MAVIHHALGWDMTDAACTAARAVAALAQAGDGNGLSHLGDTLYRQALAFGPVLAAFELEDCDYVQPWLTPATVAPALVTLLAWIPAMSLIEGDAGRALATRYRRDGSPVAPLAPTGDAFLPLGRTLNALFGHAGFAARPTPGTLGVWARTDRLMRRLQASGDSAGVAMLAAKSGPAAARQWLISTTLW